MDISFKNDRERTFYESKRALTRSYGARMAEEIIKRVGELQAARTPQQLPGNARFHEHAGQRKGLFSVDLVHPYRLIVRPTCTYDSWVDIVSVEIYEVMDPH